MRTTKMMLAGLIAIAAATAALADSWAPPRPRVFASEHGMHGFKVLKPEFGGKAVGQFFTLDEQGKEKVLWEDKLVNTPNRVVVPDFGKHVVTVDTYGTVGYDHSLVIYGEKGKVIADLKLEDLLTKEEIGKHVKASVSSRWWSGDAEFKFEGDEFVIRLKWGKTLKVSLATGKVS
jgi:hypothetical protein